MSKTTFTPGPWNWKDIPSAGLEIFGPVDLVEAVELPFDVPPVPINIAGLAGPQNVLIGYERWVQFEPKGWHDMQVANIRLMAEAPMLLQCLEEILILGNDHEAAVRDARAVIARARGEA